MALALSTVVPVTLFHDGPFRWRAGTRLTDDDDWLQFDLVDLAADRAEKDRILREHRADTFVTEPGTEAPAAEVATLADAALRRVGLPGLGAAGDVHPLEHAARMVHEDLILLQRRPHGWVMTAGAVCFPTRWSPAAKIGRTMASIHDQVPQYDTIAPAVDRLFDRLRAGAVVWRPNWSVVGQPDLRLPVEDRQAPATMPTDPDRELWLRVERQTLRRLVEHPDHLVFTVRVHRWRLADVVDQIDRALASELRTMPSDIAAYKNLDGWRHELADHLERPRSG